LTGQCFAVKDKAASNGFGRPRFVYQVPSRITAKRGFLAARAENCPASSIGLMAVSSEHTAWADKGLRNILDRKLRIINETLG
jgi:hypothetical protein